MVYRKTEKVLAHLANQREMLLERAVTKIKISGFDKLTSDTLAARAKVSVGMIYKYFPDMAELRAAIVQRLLDQDLALMRDRAAEETGALRAFSGSITVFYTFSENANLFRAMAEQPAYRAGIRAELESLIKEAAPDLTPKDRAMSAASVLGAVYGLVDVSPSARIGAPMAVLFALRGIGVSDTAARKIIAGNWGSELALALA
jgi:AcrR family transcriptional regulator